MHGGSCWWVLWRRLAERRSGSEALKITVHRERITSEQTVVMTFAGGDGEYVMAVKIAEGSVAACQLVDDPDVVDQGLPPVSAARRLVGPEKDHGGPEALNGQVLGAE
ncbi:hypothetical protein ACWEU6_11615 [Streptosporangium sandarakinum]